MKKRNELSGEFFEIEKAFRKFQAAEQRIKKREEAERQSGRQKRPVKRRWFSPVILGVLALLIFCVLIPPLRYPVDGKATSLFFPELHLIAAFYRSLSFTAVLI